MLVLQISQDLQQKCSTLEELEKEKEKMSVKLENQSLAQHNQKQQVQADLKQERGFMDGNIDKVEKQLDKMKKEAEGRCCN